MKIQTVLLLSALAISDVLAAEFLKLSNDAGASTEAKIIEVKDDFEIVTIQMKDGRELEAKMSSFSKKSRKSIMSWFVAQEAEATLLPKDPPIEVLFQYKKINMDNYKKDTLAEKNRERYKPKLIIRNKRAQEYKGNRVSAMIFAKPANNLNQVLVASALHQTIDIPYKDSITLDLDPFQISDVKKNGRTQHGYSIQGYVIFIKNSKGEVVYTKSTSKKFEDLIEKLGSVQSGRWYDPKFSAEEVNGSHGAYYELTAR
ncbi:MAG: hypothetical protein AAF065_08205 [Verrucomicrobiota bacterium]